MATKKLCHNLFRALLFGSFVITSCQQTPPIPGPPSQSLSTAPATISATKQISTLPLSEDWCISGKSRLSRPLYSGGLVFVISEDPKNQDDAWLYEAYDVNDGTLVWSTAVLEYIDGRVGTAGYWDITDGRMVVGSSTQLGVLDSQTGKSLWKMRYGGFRGFSVANERVLVSTDEAIEAYDIDTGELMWRTKQGPGRYDMPVYDSKNQTVVANFDEYYILDFDTGHILAKLPKLNVPVEAYKSNVFRVLNGKLVYGDLAFNAQTGEVLHPFTTSHRSMRPPTVAGGKLFLNNWGEVVAINESDFSVAWHYRFARIRALGSPVAIGETVYILLSDATLRAVDLNTGKEIGYWQGKRVLDTDGLETPFSADLVANDNKLFATFGTNELCAFEFPNP